MMKNNKTVHFFVVTNYHIIIASLIRESLPKDYNAVLIINNVLPDVLRLRTKLEQLDRWSEVVIFDSGMIQDFTNLSAIKKIFVVSKFNFLVRKFILRFRISELYIFTVGDLSSNTFSSSKLIENKFICEDGTYPYYGGVQMYDSGNVHLTKMDSISGWIFSVVRVQKFLKRFIYKLAFPSLIINTKEWFGEAVLLKPELYDAGNDDSDIKIRNVNLGDSAISNVFAEFTKIFEYKHTDTYRDADLIFIDSGMVGEQFLSMEEQVDFTINILKIFCSGNILVKLSPYCTQKRLIYIEGKINSIKNIELDYENRFVPWEVVYSNNIEQLSNSTIATYRSTAVISPYIIFNKSPKIAVFCSVLLKSFNLVQHDRVYAEQFVETIYRLEKLYPDGFIELPLEIDI
tara:strand:+ start:2083 stop:3288 length:1206 start_codon:yes stop_codon:yes gene_type:complete